MTPSRWLPAVKKSASCAGGEWLLRSAAGGNPVVVGGGLLVHWVFRLSNPLGLSRTIFHPLCHSKNIFAWRLIKNPSSPQTRINTSFAGVAGQGVEPWTSGYGPDEIPFLYPAIKLFFAFCRRFFRPCLALHRVGNCGGLRWLFARTNFSRNVAVETILRSAFS